MSFDFPNMEDLTERLRASAVRREEDKERRTNAGEDVNAFVKENACMAAGIRCAARIEDDYLAAKEMAKPIYEGWQAACEQYGNDSSVADAYKPKVIAANQIVALILDRFHKYMDDEGFGRFVLGENFGAMLNVLSGKL